MLHFPIVGLMLYLKTLREIDFLLTGYETTANTLSYTTYLPATDPDIQEKLRAEID